MTLQLDADAVITLIDSKEIADIYEWGISITADILDADMVKIAERQQSLLVPIASTDDGNTGKEFAVSIDASIPGGVLRTGESTIIDDRTAVRGEAVTAESTSSDYQHRSVLCVPVGSYGVLMALARAVNAFDEQQLTNVEQVASIIAAARDNEIHLDTDLQKQTLEEIGRLASHDLTNKLSIAHGNLELARQKGDMTFLDDCKRGITGIESIGRIISTLARTGVPVDSLQSVDLAETATTVYASLKTTRSTLTIQETGTIRADPSCLEQIFENLFRNALDHSDGDIEISVGLTDDGFYVADDGPGIPGELYNQVKEPGFSTQKNSAGSGLTIVEQLADAHGWDVAIGESTDGGARFTFSNVKIA